MRALTVVPKQASSLAMISDHPEPRIGAGELLVDASLVGVCGTDREIIAGSYGQAPPGRERLVIGHESLGRVRECAPGLGFEPGDWVVGIVRRPDPVPCACCAAGEWDMCRNGEYTERGIRGLDGYASERFSLDARFAVKVPAALAEHGVLLEPASVVAKAWEQVDRIAARSAALTFRNVLVTGAGPIGLLAALLAAQRGYRVTVLDREDQGIKPDLVRELGLRFHAGKVSEVTPPDIVIECTGSEQLVVDILAHTAANSITCLAGVSSGARKVALYASQFNDAMVLENDLVFGSVNANRRHYALALDALLRAEPRWLSRLISRRVPFDDFAAAFERQRDDVKVVLDLRA